MREHKTPQLVVFDLYGTLVNFGIKHSPYKKILEWAKKNGRQPQEDDARRLMTVNEEPAGLFLDLGIAIPATLLDEFHQEVEEELTCLHLFDDVISTLDFLVGKNIPLAICSNLAKPYGCVIKKLMPQYSFIECLSYEVGAIKPDPAIYKKLVNLSGVAPNKILFVGDTLLADYQGPINYGFEALHLVRRNKVRTDGTIRTLRDLQSLID